MQNDTPDARRKLLAEQRSEAQKRMEARRDEVIAMKKAAAANKDKDTTGQKEAIELKTTAQNLVTAMKRWAKLSKENPAPSADDIAIAEKEIASLTVKLAGMAPNKEVKARFVASIKQLLMRGKLALQDASETNLSDLNTALKAVGDDLKEFITSASSASQGTSVSPAAASKAHPGMLALQHTRTASSPNITMRKTGETLSNDPLATSGELTQAITKKEDLNTSSSKLGLSSSSVPTLRGSSASIPAAVLSSSVSTVPEHTYDDGSPAPAPSQDIASAIWEQQERFPKLAVPWVLEYLANQVVLRGGGISVGQFEPMLPEKKLAPYDVTYACGNVSWLNEKDYLIPLSLLKRYMWHMPSSIVPDRQEALACREPQEIISYANAITLHKRDVLAFVVGYIRTVGKLRGGEPKVADVEAVFAPLVLRSSSNYNSRDHKMKIPRALDDEIRFLHTLVRDWDLDSIAKQSEKERARLFKQAQRGSYALPPGASVDVPALRKLCSTWVTDKELRDSTWELPTCSHCQATQAAWVVECRMCSKCIYKFAGGGGSGAFKFPPVEPESLFRYLPTYQYEVGCNRVSSTLRTYTQPRVELPQSSVHWFQDVFQGKPHFNILIQDPRKDNKTVTIVSILRPPDGLQESFPARALILDEQEGYSRVVIEVPLFKKKILDPSHVVAAVKAAPLSWPADAKFTCIDNPKLADALADFESKASSNNYKFGVLYLGGGQSTEEQMYNNHRGSEAYDYFLASIANKVTLAEHKGFRGGLDCKGENTTGEFSFHTALCHNLDGTLATEEGLDTTSVEIMWHVATLLPFDPDNVQQLHRKRHLGNDLVIVVFTESDAPFDPTTFASQFNHVWIVVRPHERRADRTPVSYQISVVSKLGVKPFRPFLPNPPILEDGPKFREWFLLKCINAEKAAYFAKDFSLKESRTRTKMFEHWEGTYMEAPVSSPSGGGWMQKLSSTASLLTSWSGGESGSGGDAEKK